MTRTARSTNSTVERPFGRRRLLGVAALSMALVPSHAALGAGRTATIAGGAANQAQSTATPPSIVATTDVVFDGTIVTASNIDSFAKDPVLAFGQGVDADGRPIPGEMWVLVAKKDKAIFYELTEEHASGKGSYAGYTIKVKTVTTHQIPQLWGRRGRARDRQR